MAKKDKDKKKQSKKGSDDPVAALRAAVEGTLKASAEGASATRERTREIVDEIAAAAGRVRHTLEDMRVLDEVKRLHAGLPGHVLLVLDAAYAEYVRRNDYASGLELVATSENVVMTPHTAGASQHRAARNLDRFCENLRRVRVGEPLLGIVDKQLGY